MSSDNEKSPDIGIALPAQAEARSMAQRQMVIIIGGGLARLEAADALVARGFARVMLEPLLAAPTRRGDISTLQ
jgi:hypothetical protein